MRDFSRYVRVLPDSVDVELGVVLDTTKNFNCMLTHGGALPWYNVMVDWALKIDYLSIVVVDWALEIYYLSYSGSYSSWCDTARLTERYNPIADSLTDCQV